MPLVASTPPAGLAVPTCGFPRDTVRVQRGRSAQHSDARYVPQIAETLKQKPHAYEDWKTLLAFAECLGLTGP